MRKLVGEVIQRDPRIELAGTAADGREAIAKTAQLNPDLITLDVEMPGMNGLQALAEIRRAWPRLPVIMLSALTRDGATVTLQALDLGATDFVAKTVAAGAGTFADRLAAELVPKILTHAAPPLASAAVNLRAAPSPRQRVDVVAIAASTGGPKALARIAGSFTEPLPVPVLIVQHMPVLFTRIFAERLSANCCMAVHEAQDGQRIVAGEIYIAPGGRHMEIYRQGTETIVRLQNKPPENECRPAADVLFRSIAAVYGRGTLAVVLTGMGRDGLHGCEAIASCGGQIIVQDQGTSIIWGMPGAVAQAGLAGKVLPVGEICPEILQCVRRNNRGLADAQALLRRPTPDNIALA